MNRRRVRTAISLIAFIILIAVAKFGSFDKATVPAQESQPARVDARPVPPRAEKPAETRASEAGTERDSDASSDLSRIAPDQSERAQIETTLRLIASNGPFPHKRDGIVFANREGRLPNKPRGYYREYTVETPGASTRGARRIIRGDAGETYYTRDHYGSFIRIDEGGSVDR